MLAGSLVGCASIGAPVPPSLALPKPPSDLRAVRKGSKVYLFWTVPSSTTDRQNVRRPGPTRVCRSLTALMSQCDTPVGNVPPVATAGKAPSRATPSQNPKPQSEFVDILPADLEQRNALGTATYAVEAMNLHARSAGLSNQAQVALAPTMPPPANFSVQMISDGVVLTWDCATFPQQPPGLGYVYRLYRRSSDPGTEVRLSDQVCPGGRFEDRTIEWEKSYEYRITVVTSAKLDRGVPPCPAKPSDHGVLSIADCTLVAEIEGDDSPVQQVFTKDIYPPGVPTGLQAVFSGPGQTPFIDLLWAPDTDSDLAGYNVYRRAGGTQPAKINHALVKTPAYRDADLVPGKTYGYSVSAVDLRGNESARSEETSEAVPDTP